MLLSCSSVSWMLWSTADCPSSGPHAQIFAPTLCLPLQEAASQSLQRIPFGILNVCDFAFILKYWSNWKACPDLTKRDSCFVLSIDFKIVCCCILYLGSTFLDFVFGELEHNFLEEPIQYSFFQWVVQHLIKHRCSKSAEFRKGASGIIMSNKVK